MPDNGKECECKGLSLLIQMTEVYDTWLEDMRRAELLFATIAPDIFRHLNSEFNTPKYAEHQEPYKALLNNIRPPFDPRELLKTSMTVMEKIRNAIHENPELQQLLTCGPVYTKENETESTRIVREALELMETATPSEAHGRLERQAVKLTCLGG